VISLLNKKEDEITANSAQKDLEIEDNLSSEIKYCVLNGHPHKNIVELKSPIVFSASDVQWLLKYILELKQDKETSIKEIQQRNETIQSLEDSMKEII
jgi:hypothetical protein